MKKADKKIFENIQQKLIADEIEWTAAMDKDSTFILSAAREEEIVERMFLVNKFEEQQKLISQLRQYISNGIEYGYILDPEDGYHKRLLGESE